jgi:hypothetical protein
VEFEPVVMFADAGVHRVDAGDAHAALFDITIPLTPTCRARTGFDTPPASTRMSGPRDLAVGEPFDEPPISVTCSVRIAGRTLRLSAPALFEEAFAGGYRRLATAILPPISCRPLLDRYFLRTQGASQQINLLVSVVGHDHTGLADRGGARSLRTGGVDGEPVLASRSGCARTATRTRSRCPSPVPPGEAAGRRNVSLGIRLWRQVVRVVDHRCHAGSERPDSVPDEDTYVRREVVAQPSAVVVDLIDVPCRTRTRTAT